MKIPELFYGLPRDVKRRCERAVTALKRGGSLADALGSELLDTATTDGLIVLDGPSPLVGGLEQFCMYPLCLAAESRLEESARQAVHDELLGPAWGVLALQGQGLQTWLAGGQRRRLAFLRGCLRHWDTLEREGVRYSSGSNTPTTVWGASRCLYFALANEGASTELLREFSGDLFEHGDVPKHEGGLRRLMERAGLLAAIEAGET